MCAVALVHWLCSSSGHWDSMEEYTCMIPRDTHDGAFYRAVLALHQDLFSLAQQVRCGAAARCTLISGLFLGRNAMGVWVCSQLLELSSVSLSEIQKHWKLSLTDTYKVALRVFQTGFSSRHRLRNRNKRPSDYFGVFFFSLFTM